MDHDNPGSAEFRLLMRRLDGIEQKLINKSDLTFSMLMAHAFTVLTLAGTVVVLEAIFGSG